MASLQLSRAWDRVAYVGPKYHGLTSILLTKGTTYPKRVMDNLVPLFQIVQLILSCHFKNLTILFYKILVNQGIPTRVESKEYLQGKVLLMSPKLITGSNYLTDVVHSMIQKPTNLPDLHPMLLVPSRQYY